MNEQHTATERRTDRLATPESRVSSVSRKQGAVQNSDPWRQSMAEVEHEPPTTGAHRSFVRGYEVGDGEKSDGEKSDGENSSGNGSVTASENR